MSFDNFVGALAQADVEFQHLKIVQLAQAILESGRGGSQLFTDHLNPYGMKYRSEMASFATSVTYTDSAGETDQYCKFPDYATAVLGYWRFVDRAPYSGWRAASSSAEEFIRFITYAGYLGGPHDTVPPAQRAADRVKKNQYIQKIRALFPEARQRLDQANRAFSTAGQIWSKRGVYIDVGHGRKPEGYDPGAVNGQITEHSLNLVAASACRSVLEAAGVPVKVDDALASNYDAGRAAAGYDVFVSIHHNSSNGGPAQGAEAFSHSGRGIAADRRLSALIATAMADELGINNRGQKTGNLSVLSGARDAGVRAASLAELYFIHAQTPPNPNPSQFNDWSRRGGGAIGQAILEWLRETA